MDDRLRQVWGQRNVPVLVRLGTGHPLRLRLPTQQRPRTFEPGHYGWIKQNQVRSPQWQGHFRCWDAPQAWFNELVRRLLGEYRRLYIIQPHRPQEKCAPACWNATGHECQCQCLGENHGSRSAGGGWFVVSEAFATRWGKAELACRLMLLRP